MSGVERTTFETQEMAINIKLEKEDILTIIFGLGIADAWEGMKMEKGEASCLGSKGYYKHLQYKLDKYYNNYEKYRKVK